MLQVRDGRTVLVLDSSELVSLDPALAILAGSGLLALSSKSPSQYGVEALFEQIEAALKQDETSGRRNFTSAQFDPVDGHPIHFRRSVSGTKEGVEWNVKIMRFPETSDR